MFNKALWKKDYKQAKFILWSIWVLLFFGMPIQAAIRLQGLTELIKEQKENDSSYVLYTDYFYHSILNFTSIYNVLLFMIFVLASTLIGAERGNKTNDFTFSLPFSRKEVFLSKWIIGFTFIVTSFVLSFILSQAFIYFSAYREYLNIEWSFVYFIYPFLSFIALYTLALFFGTITGGFIYQVALAFIFFIFPLGIPVLMFRLFENIFRLDMYELYYSRTIFNITDVLYLGHYYDISAAKRVFFHILQDAGGVQADLYSYQSYDYLFSYHYLLFPVLLTLTLLPISIFLYQRNKVENNGMFLIFPQLNKFFMFGIVFCFALFGGLIGETFVSNRLEQFRMINYFCGFIGFGVISYFFTKKLYKLNLKISSR
ncbi:ABC transporter permease [Chengkuizengella axinellae]|uniref:ABC transporter permease n=1 Tax=Chengkuizengella axinellae TaxID=3064388 RepID=A0ABT9IXM3_9BACL|nr:ABC transporter permease [Chengkuizengella sp. 2205SS18-9]MDP5274120.1 ABC transporter permease [Chengkuizengella sp. 2205SS18-9]